VKRYPLIATKSGVISNIGRRLAPTIRVRRSDAELVSLKVSLRDPFRDKTPAKSNIQDGGGGGN